MAERETEDAGHVDDAAQLGLRRPEGDDEAGAGLDERIVRGPMHGREPYGGRHRRLPRPYLLAEVDEQLVPAGAGQLEHDEEADDAALADGRPADRHRGGIGRFLRDLVMVAVLALAISVAMKTFLLRPYYIPSASMHETLVENDRVLVNLLVPEAVPLARGDVVVFTDPGGWLPAHAPVQKTPTQALVDGFLELVGLKPEDSDNTLIKRVIGLPGDRVVCCNAYGQVTVNDVAIAEPYVELSGNSAASGIAFDVTVPSEAIWVMGDNRYNSQDSRYHQGLPSGGFVPMSSVVGRAFMINLPLDRFGMLGSYPEVFANVPNRQPGQTP